MNVRLVAYRKATSGASSTTAYNLDLQEAPNVSINYKFSDVKNPETRKGSYSQTFKLPFTDNNNEFFQNWYNVNLETLVFSSRTKFDAILYVGAVPQFEGALQLKSVYKKAQMYEVVLMSTSASLFSTIGTQKLRDAFKNENGSYDNQFNHTFTYTNSTNNTLYNSWGNSLVNTSGTSLYDSDAGVSKVVYPISVTREKFYYNPADQDADGNDLKRYLRLDQTTINSINDGDVSFDLSVQMSQFRPALQLKTMFKMILARAGFSYTSSFIDGSYFGKLFMTTGNHLETTTLPTTDTNASPSGFMDVGNSTEWGVLDLPASGFTGVQDNEVIVPADTITPTTGNTSPQDPDNIWNETYSYFTRTDITMTQVSCRHILTASNIQADVGDAFNIDIFLRPFDTSTNTPDLDYNYGIQEATETTTSSNTVPLGFRNWNLSLEDMPVGASAQIVIRVYNYKKVTAGSALELTIGKENTVTVSGQTFFNVGNDLYSNIRIDWVGYSTDSFGGTINVPFCIDPDITQKDFLKDLIERFNLLILTDPDDDTNLIVEPYNDYLDGGSLKYWSDKLDTSKEIIVKDTTTLQNKTIHLTDQEDVDLYNKELKDRFPDVNVFGHLKITDSTNEFATGEMKNKSIFSPFINSQVFASDNTQLGTYLINMSPQYEFSYEESEGVFENKIKKTKPKLFYYSGTATTVKDVNNETVTYNLHRSYNNSGTLTVTAFEFTKYPLCSPFELTTNNDVSTLSTTTKSLYWNSTPPLVGNLAVFNYSNDVGSWFNNSLYGLYWKKYLDSLYDPQARIMECYLNLNEVDIFNFKFNDEILIKDTYWRVLEISNYQVGVKASTKVTLIKVLDELVQCDYVTSTIGVNNTSGNWYLWCPDNNPGCTPDITSGDLLGYYANPACCEGAGGIPMYNYTSQASNGLYPCLANASSLPVRLKSIFSANNILDVGQLKTLIYNKIGGRNKPLVRGVNTSKYSQSLLPLYGNDIVVKYNTKKRNIPQIQGESHRIVLSGNTTGNTKGYAYIESDQYGTPLRLPNNINMIIRVKGISTVVGGTSATYTLGSTEAFAYYTAFKNVSGTTTQLSTAGGQQEFSIREGANPTTCTLYIDVLNGVLRFGLQDSQTDTKRVWQLSADIDVNIINNMTLGHGENWALYQNSRNIQLQNGDYLIWN